MESAAAAGFGLTGLPGTHNNRYNPAVIGFEICDSLLLSVRKSTWTASGRRFVNRVQHSVKVHLLGEPIAVRLHSVANKSRR